MTDIEIARGTKLRKIVEVANDLGIDEEDISLYGKYKCKIDNSVYDKISDRKDGKLILVTAISPTPLGEGKTTMSIAIADGLRKIGKKSIKNRIEKKIKELKELEEDLININIIE